MTDSQAQPSAATGKPSIRPLIYALCCPILGAVLFAACDLWWAKKFVPIALSGEEKVLIAAHGTGLHVYLGFVLGLIQAAILLLAPKKIGRFDGRVLGFTALFSAIFVFANWDIADGAGISKQPIAPFLRWGTRLGGPIGIWIALGVLKRFMGPFVRRRDPVVIAWVLGLGFAGAAAFAAKFNMTWLPGRYPGIHMQAALGALLFAQSAVFLISRHRPVQLDRGAWKSLATIVLGLAVVLISAFILRSEKFVPLRSSVTNIVPGTTPFRPAIDPFFSRFVKKQELTRKDMADIRAKQIAEGNIDVTKILDKIPNRENFNVLAIAIDTVRYDYTSLGGYTKHPTTPNLQRLVDEEKAFNFRQAYTSYPTSNYAYSSFLTGMHAGATPLHLWRSYKTDWSGSEEVYYPKLLSNRGLASTGIFAFSKEHRRNKRFFGMLENGWDSFNPDQVSEAAMIGTEITTSLFKQLKSRSSKRFFTMAHYIDAHDPYVTMPPWDFGTDTKDRYASEIAYVDNELGRVIEFMKTEGLWDDTILVVFADHGESLGDHTFSTHNTSLYEAEIRIPLVIRIPGIEGEAVDSAVALTDVMPSLLKVMKIDDPVKRLGKPMLPHMLGYQDLSPRLVFSEQYTPRQTMRDLEQRAVIYQRKKLIEILTKPERTYELYDLEKDPGETRNLFGRPEAADLQAEMLGFLVEVSKETKEIIGGEELLEPEERLEKELRAALKNLEAAGDRDESRVACAKIRVLLLNRYDDLNALTALLDPELIEKVRKTVFQRAMSELPKWNYEALNLLRLLPHEENAEYMRALMKQRAVHVQYTAALAMAKQGGAAAQEAKEFLIKRAESTADIVERFDAAVALAELGDSRWIDVYWPYFRGDRFSESTWQLGPLLKAFTKAKNPNGLETLGDRLALGELNDFTLRQRALQYAAAIESPEADRVLMQFAKDLDTGLRDEARAALAARYGVEERDRRLANFELEHESLVALMNGQADTMVGILSRYAESNPDYPAYIDFPHARALCQINRRDDARRVLERAVEKGNEEQKEAAKRWLQHLPDIRWFYQVNDLKADLEVTYPVKMTKRNRVYGMKAKLTNRSSVFWPGGALGFGLVLRTWLLDEDGNPVKEIGGKKANMHRINNFLPLKGIKPGESVDVFIVGHAPSGKWENLRIGVALCQNDTPHVPDDKDFIFISERRYKAE